MADVFICHAAEDRATANAVCHRLEAEGIRCWIAPRDVTGGANYAAEIVQAIQTSSLVVIVFSHHANLSRHVHNEIERSVHYERPILPFRVEDVPPAGGLELHLADRHWLDAMTPPLKKHLDRLAAHVLRLLPNLATPVTSPGMDVPSFSEPSSAHGTRVWKLLAGVFVVLVLMLAAALVYQRTGPDQIGPGGQAKPTQTPSAGPAGQPQEPPAHSGQRTAGARQVTVPSSDVTATVPAGPREEIAGPFGMAFVQIPPGEFLMGWECGSPEEKPVHRVRITRGFQMGRYEVTQAQWETVMGNNPSKGKIKWPTLAVSNVSWEDVQAFINRLNTANDGYRYRLPTEAEWEYAYRAGTQGDYPAGAGREEPNPWGLCSMHGGKVAEWCQDWWAKDYYAVSPTDDPQGPTWGSKRVQRNHPTKTTPCRSAPRYGNEPWWSEGSLIGFRLVRNR